MPNELDDETNDQNKNMIERINTWMENPRENELHKTINNGESEEEEESDGESDGHRTREKDGSEQT